MKRLKIYIILSLSLLFFNQQAQAQDYKFAAGLRLGYPASVSLKYFISENGALEGIIGTRRYGYLGYRYRSNVVGGAYLYHSSLEIDELPGLKWYIGAGASMYIYTYDRDIVTNDRVNSSLGVQAYGGLDYTIEDTPLNLSVDWSPAIIFNGINSGWGAGYGSLGIRYILK